MSGHKAPLLCTQQQGGFPSFQDVLCYRSEELWAQPCPAIISAQFEAACQKFELLVSILPPPGARGSPSYLFVLFPSQDILIIAGRHNTAMLHREVITFADWHLIKVVI